MKAWILSGLLVFGIPSLAQNLALEIHSNQELPRWIKSEYTGLTAGKVLKLKRTIISDLIRKGHLEASFDSCQTEADLQSCTLHIGRVYQWANISHGNLARAAQAGFRERTFRNETLNPADLAKVMEGVITHFENNGFPFVSVALDSLRWSEEGIKASLNVQRNGLRKIDEIVIKGECRTSLTLLQEKMDISTGDRYDESKIRRIEKRLKELPFVRITQPPYVLFTETRTQLYLFLEDKNASSVSGIVGVLPNEATGKVTFTGDLDLDLRNSLKRGETIALEWRRLQDQTQDLDLRTNYPYLFNSPFGADAQLRIYRRDTTFLEVASQLGFSLDLEDGDRLTAFIRRNSSSRLGRRNTFSTELADTRSTFYGLDLQRDRTDYRRNPRRGHIVSFTGAVGSKNSTPITPIGSELIPSTRSVQYEVSGAMIGHVAIGKRGTIRISARGGSMINEVLYRNELFRIGGFKDMRGVDDVAITASSWIVNTIEYRFLFEENSNFLLFVDQGWWEDPVDSYIRDTPRAFGVGTNFETETGIFSLSYAMGSQFGEPVRFNNAKVHFGFASLF